MGRFPQPKELSGGARLMTASRRSGLLIAGEAEAEGVSPRDPEAGLVSQAWAYMMLW